MAQQRPNLPANIPQNLIPPRPAIPPSIQDIGQTGLTVHRLRTSKNTLGNVTDAELGAWDEYHHTLMVTRGAQAAPAWFMQAFAQGGVANTAINQAIANACVPNGAIDQAITNACAPNGVINQTVNQAITNACAPNGVINQTVNQAITNACAPNGVINQTVNQAITNACAPNGNIYNLINFSNQISRARAINANATRDTDQLCEFPDIQGILPSALGIVFPQNKGALRDNLTLGQYNALLAHYNQQIYRNRNNAKESLRVYLGVPPF